MPLPPFSGSPTGQQVIQDVDPRKVEDWRTLILSQAQLVFPGDETLSVMIFVDSHGNWVAAIVSKVDHMRTSLGQPSAPFFPHLYRVGNWASASNPFLDRALRFLFENLVRHISVAKLGAT